MIKLGSESPKQDSVQPSLAELQNRPQLLKSRLKEADLAVPSCWNTPVNPRLKVLGLQRIGR